MLELVNLTKYYPTPMGRHYVFRDLNFKFPEEASIGLMGRNGAGKSTLMRIIAGVEVPNQGYVRTDKSMSWQVGLAGGFQGSLSSRDNVRFVCRLFSTTPEETREKVRFVEEFAYRVAQGFTIKIACAGDIEAADHPARWPYRLAEDIVRCFCPPDGLVCDPFLGAGTTAAAAIANGRRAVGGDLYSRQTDGVPWIEVADQILRERLRQQALFPPGLEAPTGESRATKTKEQVCLF